MKFVTDYQPDGNWIAYDADNYEAQSDTLGWWVTSPVGHGRTREQALEDLLNEIAARANA